MNTNYASIGKRFAAAIIDGIIISIVMQVIGAIIGQGNLLNIIQLVATIAYGTAMLSNYGATAGKMAMKIKVVKEDGSLLTPVDALTREASKILSGIVLGLGYLWALWDEKKQGWHDKIAKTLVVNA